MVPGQDDTFKAHTDGHAYGDKLLAALVSAVDVFFFPSETGRPRVCKRYWNLSEATVTVLLCKLTCPLKINGWKMYSLQKVNPFLVDIFSVFVCDPLFWCHLCRENLVVS